MPHDERRPHKEAPRKTTAKKSSHHGTRWITGEAVVVEHHPKLGRQVVAVLPVIPAAGPSPCPGGAEAAHAGAVPEVEQDCSHMATDPHRPLESA